jgi:CRISPR-associated endonuclease/helicase Cas3
MLLSRHQQYNTPDMINAVSEICLAHDFGKATSFFQKYIVAENKDKYRQKTTHHAYISAVFAYWWLPAKYKVVGYLAVKRHHGDILDVCDEFDYNNIDGDNFELIQQQISDITSNVNTCAELEQIYNIKISEFKEFLTRRNLALMKQDILTTCAQASFTIQDIITLNYISSLLLTADKAQLIRNYPKLPPQKDVEYVSIYKEQMRFNIIQDTPILANSRLFAIRENIFTELQAELQNIDLSTESFFSINIPTGTGKTLLAYYAALYIAAQQQPSKIIYALPYMSIIDQNTTILSNIIEVNEHKKPNSVSLLRHHSLAEVTYNTDDMIYANYDARFYYDNWQSNIITTTFVQLFNTIFKVGNHSISHRFHQLYNSVVVLDEIQAIDEKYYSVICSMLKQLAKDFNMKFIFVTATMPLLIDSHELIPQNREYFNMLNRIQIHNNTQHNITLDVFIDIITTDIINRPEKSFLVVCNTIKSAKQVYQKLKEEFNQRRVIYISTEIYPKARLNKIQNIRNLTGTQHDKPIIVSTQLIEAGVDIDIDIIYRDFCPLSSVNQTAGRANRNWINNVPSEVHLYCIVNEHGKELCSMIYPGYLLQITRNILPKDIIHESSIYDLNKQYSTEVARCTSPDCGVDIMTAISRLDCKQLRNLFELINNDYICKYDIIIDGDEQSHALIQQLKILSTQALTWRDNSNIQNIFRKLNMYRISVYSGMNEYIAPYLKTIDRFNLKYLPLTNGIQELYSVECGMILDSDKLHTLVI